MRYLIVCLFLAACANASASTKKRDPAAETAIPRCWKAYNPKLHDGLYHITIPATDALTAKDVQVLLFSLQAFGVKSHETSAVGSDSIVLEAQFISLTDGKNLGYGTQDKLDELVAFVLKDDIPYLSKGVTITCFEEHPLIHH